MKFEEKIEILRVSGLNIKVLTDETFLINIKGTNLYHRDYAEGGEGHLSQSDEDIECMVYTREEYILSESEILESIYFNDFEAILKKSFQNSSNLIDLIFTESLALKIAEEQVDNRYLTKYNCLTFGNEEIIEGNLYIVPR